MKRHRIGLICAVLGLAGCDHHRQASQTESRGAAVSQEDSAYTGAPPVTPSYPRAQRVVSVPAPSAPPQANPTPGPEVSTPPAQAIPPRSPVPESSKTAAAPASVPAATQQPVPSSAAESTPAPAAEVHVEPTRLEVNPSNPPVVAVPAPAMTDTEAQKEVVVLATSFGRIVIELDDISAPRTCGNFRKLVSDGFFIITRSFTASFPIS